MSMTIVKKLVWKIIPYPVQFFGYRFVNHHRKFWRWLPTNTNLPQYKPCYTWLWFDFWKKES